MKFIVQTTSIANVVSFFITAPQWRGRRVAIEASKSARIATISWRLGCVVATVVECRTSTATRISASSIAKPISRA